MRSFDILGSSNDPKAHNQPLTNHAGATHAAERALGPGGSRPGVGDCADETQRSYEGGNARDDEVQFDERRSV